mgnify:CR=1 FL=1
MIVQKVREAERSRIVDIYQPKIGQLIFGIVKRVEKGNVFIDLGMPDKQNSMEEAMILKNFKYRKNTAIIHFDDSIMPKNKKAWCSWNCSMSKDNIEKTSVTYWLNQLQTFRLVIELGTSSTLILGNKTTTYSKLGLDVFTAQGNNMYLMDFRSTFSFICITNHCNVLQ